MPAPEAPSTLVHLCERFWRGSRRGCAGPAIDATRGIELEHGDASTSRNRAAARTRAGDAATRGLGDSRVLGAAEHRGRLARYHHTPNTAPAPQGPALAASCTTALRSRSPPSAARPRTLTAAPTCATHPRTNRHAPPSGPASPQRTTVPTDQRGRAPAAVWTPHHRTNESRCTHHRSPMYPPVFADVPTSRFSPRRRRSRVVGTWG